MNGSAACTTFGVIAVTITRRTAVWRGGSSSPSSRSSDGTSTPGAFIPDALENVSVSRSTARVFGVARDVPQPAGHGRDRSLVAQISEQRPRRPGIAAASNGSNTAACYRVAPSGQCGRARPGR